MLGIVRVRTNGSADAYGDTPPVTYNRPRWALYSVLSLFGANEGLDGHAALLSAA